MQEKFLKQQEEMMQNISLCDSFKIQEIKTIAGVDLAYWQSEGEEYAVCCIVVIDMDTHEVIEKKQFSGKIEVPYCVP